jgi:hypothetical protein
MKTFDEFLDEGVKVEIKKKSSNEANVSARHVTYDLHVNGKYHTTHKDVNDALDHKERIEKAGKIVD